MIRTSRNVELTAVRQLSTAKSSPLNTPDLADWPTRLGGSQSLLLDNFAPPSDSPSPVARYRKSSAARQSIAGPIHHPRTSSPASRSPRFAAHHLDPPLLNFIPGLAHLDLSFPVPPTEIPFDRVFSSPSPRSSIDGHVPGSPVGDVAALSPSFTPSSISSFLHPPNSTDSPILPSRNVGTPCDDQGGPGHLPPAQEMDAFALAAAVAASNSRSSFSLPPSVQSATVALPTMASEPITCEVSAPRPHAYRQASTVTAASTAPHVRDVAAPRQEASEDGPLAGLEIPGPESTARARRSSAPPPTSWQSPRIQPVRTISSRVDVGDADGTGRKTRHDRQPVLGRVRKFGQRIRGLFKSKGEHAVHAKFGSTGAAPEYGLMTTTTAVTNVEYESVRTSYQRLLPIVVNMSPGTSHTLAQSSRQVDAQSSAVLTPPHVSPVYRTGAFRCSYSSSKSYSQHCFAASVTLVSSSRDHR